MKNVLSLFLVFSLSLLLISCSKSNNNDGTLPPTPTDTLSSGWSRIKLDPYVGIFYGGDIFFSSNTVGYACDNNYHVYKSADGGSTWNQLFRPDGRSFGASNIAITADNKAFFVGSNEDSIFKTINSGVTVTGYRINNAKLSDIFFGDNSVGLCSSNMGLFKTTDGGINWGNTSNLPGYSDSLYSTIFMYGNSNAWVCYGNKIFHANGNLSVFKLDSITTVPNLGITSVYAVSPLIVYASSYSGYIFKSVDGGNTFSQLTKLANYGGSGSDIHFINANTAFAGVGSRIYKTTDAGATWNVVVALAYGFIVEIHFTDAAHGWACCSDATILKFN